MSRNIKGPLCYLVSILAIVFCFIHMQHQERQAVKKVIDINSQAITSLGVAAQTQATNAHLLLQIINKLEGNGNHTKPLEDAFNINNLDISDGSDVDVSIDQIKNDITEIDRGIRSMAASNLFQRQSLELILSRL